MSNKFGKPPRPSGQTQGTKASDSMPFMVLIYVLIPTAAMIGLVAGYFYVSSKDFGLVLILGIWVIVRGFPVATMRWLGKPIPTKKRAPHVLRMYFVLLVTLIPYLVVFSQLYYSYGHTRDGSCTNLALDKMSSLYFTTTIFTTTGFGDVYAVTDGCRALVTVQMVSGFVIISILIAMFVSRLFQLIGDAGS